MLCEVLAQHWTWKKRTNRNAFKQRLSHWATYSGQKTTFLLGCLFWGWVLKKCTILTVSSPIGLTHGIRWSAPCKNCTSSSHLCSVHSSQCNAIAPAAAVVYGDNSSWATVKCSVDQCAVQRWKVKRRVKSWDLTSLLLSPTPPACPVFKYTFPSQNAVFFPRVLCQWVFGKLSPEQERLLLKSHRWTKVCIVQWDE